MRETVDTVPIDFVYLDETDRAVKLEDESGDELWLPKSQISGLGEHEKGDYIRLDVAEWIAMREGLM